MAAINTENRPVKIRIDWEPGQDDQTNVARANVGNAVGTVVSIAGRHFAFVDFAAGQKPEPRREFQSKIAAKRWAGGKMREVVA